MAYGPYHGIGDRIGLSNITVRQAFQRKPITYRTALRIANALDIPIECFRIKTDRRGCARKSDSLKSKASELKEKYNG